MALEERNSRAMAAKFLGVYESQLHYLTSINLLPRSTLNYSAQALLACKEKMKGITIPKPGPEDWMSKIETAQYSGFTETELSEFAYSGKLPYQASIGGFRFQRRAIDRFKAQLKVAGI